MLKKLVIAFLLVTTISGCTKDTTAETTVVTTPIVTTEPSSVDMSTPETTTEASAPTTIVPTPVATDNPSTSENDNPSSEVVSEDGFKTVNIAGLFDIQVLDPLPELMTLETTEGTDPDGNREGSFYLVVHSSDPNCNVESSCQFIIYGFSWYTDAAREYDLTLINVAQDKNFIQDYDTSIGHVGVYRDYTMQISGSIMDGNGPDYFYDGGSGQLTYAVEDLIRFDKD